MSSRTPDAHQVLKILGFGLALSSVDGPLCALLLNVYLGTNESKLPLANIRRCQPALDSSDSSRSSIPLFLPSHADVQRSPTP